jgi:predicted transcriptional regulator
MLILLFLLEAGEGYALQLSQRFSAGLYSVQRQLRQLEDAGVLVSRNLGKTRMFSLNPRYFLRRELEALLRKNLANWPDEQVQRLFRPRKRPRRTGKPP